MGTRASSTAPGGNYYAVCHLAADEYCRTPGSPPKLARDGRHKTWRKVASDSASIVPLMVTPLWLQRGQNDTETYILLSLVPAGISCPAS